MDSGLSRSLSKVKLRLNSLMMDHDRDGHDQETATADNYSIKYNSTSHPVDDTHDTDTQSNSNGNNTHNNIAHLATPRHSAGQLPSLIEDTELLASSSSPAVNVSTHSMDALLDKALITPVNADLRNPFESKLENHTARTQNLMVDPLTDPNAYADAMALSILDKVEVDEPEWKI